MAMEYPYSVVIGRSADDEEVRVNIRLEDEYHLIDEAGLIQAVRDYVDAHESVVLVSAEKRDVVVTQLPGA